MDYIWNMYRIIWALFTLKPNICNNPSILISTKGSTNTSNLQIETKTLLKRIFNQQRLKRIRIKFI